MDRRSTADSRRSSTSASRTSRPLPPVRRCLPAPAENSTIAPVTWRGAVIGLCLGAVGCSDGLSCTLAGCDSQTAIRLFPSATSAEYPLKVHACYDDRCIDATVNKMIRGSGQPLRFACRGDGRHVCADLRRPEGYTLLQFDDVSAGPQPHRVTIAIRSVSGRLLRRDSTVLTLAKRAPNGEKCGPICWQGHADFR